MANTTRAASVALALAADAERPRYDPATWYWVVGGDETQAWSSAARVYVPAADAAYVAWFEAGGRPSRIKDDAELWQVLRDQAPGRLPDDQRYVPVATVRERLEAIDRWDAMVDAIMTAGGYALLAKVMTLRWGILASDPQARGLITMAGADPDLVLAPE